MSFTSKMTWGQKSLPLQIQKLLEFHKSESVDWHKVKVAFKIQQIWRKLTINIVTEHISDSWNRYYHHKFSTFYAHMPWVSMKLLNWQFQFWHFNKYFILYTGTGVMNLSNIALAQKRLNESSAISSQGWLIEIISFKSVIQKKSSKKSYAVLKLSVICMTYLIGIGFTYC